MKKVMLWIMLMLLSIVVVGAVDYSDNVVSVFTFENDSCNQTLQRCYDTNNKYWVSYSNTDFVEGIQGQGIRFNSNSDVFQMSPETKPYNLSLNKPFCLMHFANLNDTQGNSYFINNIQGVYQGYTWAYAYTTNGANIQFYGAGNNNYCSKEGHNLSMADNTFHMFTVTNNGTDGLITFLRQYHDNILEEDNSASSDCGSDWRGTNISFGNWIAVDPTNSKYTIDMMVALNVSCNQSMIDWFYNSGASQQEYFINISIPTCTEDWIAQYANSSCNGTYINELKTYYDNNSCGTAGSLPGDNNTISDTFPCTIPSQSNLITDSGVSSAISFAVTIFILLMLVVAIIPKSWLGDDSSKIIMALVIIVLVLVGLMFTLNLFLHFIG